MLVYERAVRGNEGPSLDNGIDPRVFPTLGILRFVLAEIRAIKVSQSAGLSFDKFSRRFSRSKCPLCVSRVRVHQGLTFFAIFGVDEVVPRSSRNIALRVAVNRSLEERVNIYSRVCEKDRERCVYRTGGSLCGEWSN